MATRSESQLLETIRGLLAKAESTSFTAEADAFTAKAQELMAAHSIEMAMVDQGRPTGSRAEPNSVRIGIERPYPMPKVSLLAVVARANHCRVIWTEHDGVATVFGFDHDLGAVEILYTSLLVQATTAVNAHGPQTDWSGRSRTRSFRRSFLMGYANRVGWRLRDAAAASAVAAEATFGSALVPVMAEREARVEAALNRVFPGSLPMRRASSSNLSGWFAGEEAADRADLGHRRPIAS